jgi:hypothetical protein
MKSLNWKYLAKWAGFIVLCIGLTGESCLEEKQISLVVGANVEASFEARGIINEWDDEEIVDVNEDDRIRDILDDNGFEEMDVAFLESAWFRITKKDANAANRTVTGFNVTVDDTLLVAPQTSVAVNEDQYADWTPVSLLDNGRMYINQKLLEYLVSVLDDEPGELPSPVFEFHINGDSTPQDVETDFDWELRLRLTLVGYTLAEVPEL